MKEGKLRTIVGSVSMAVAIVASSFLAAAPAHANPATSEAYAIVDTGNCARLGGTLTVVARANECFLDDSADDTHFLKDAGGRAFKIEYRNGSALVAKVEFHPYAEKLYVYDTANDGDAIYVELCVDGGIECYGPYTPPGTSAVVEYYLADLDIDEDASIDIFVYDDAAQQVQLGMFYGIAFA